jgi:hypothetical protein
VSLYGDDLSFLQAHLPAVFVSDSSFTAFYPWYHQPADTPDKLDTDALEAMGRSVVGVVSALQETPRGPDSEADWFAAHGWIVTSPQLKAAAAVLLVVALLPGVSRGGLTLAARGGFVALVAWLAWRHPVPTLWVFTLPVVVALWRPRWWTGLVALAPGLALAILGVAAWRRGFVEGLWLEPWELGFVVAALGLVWVAPRARRPRGRRRSRV